jgi:hypothetical protein
MSPTEVGMSGSEAPDARALEAEVLRAKRGSSNTVPLEVGQFYLRKKGGTIRRVVKVYPGGELIDFREYFTCCRAMCFTCHEKLAYQTPKWGYLIPEGVARQLIIDLDRQDRADAEREANRPPTPTEMLANSLDSYLRVLERVSRLEDMLTRLAELLEKPSLSRSERLAAAAEARSRLEEASED